MLYKSIAQIIPEFGEGYQLEAGLGRLRPCRFLE